MSSDEINELRRLLAEVERQREEEKRQREEVEQLLSEERQLTQNTTLPEFLDACHKHLFLGLAIQNVDSSTKGNPANADRKIRPDKIREWERFPQEQMEIWKDVMATDFVTERHFTPLLALRESGKEVRRRMLGSEVDLGYFERQTVESPVASIIHQLHENPRLRQTFHLNGDITFENHANTLTDESQIVTNMSSLSLAQERPRRSKRLAAKRPAEASRSASPRGRNQGVMQSRSSRPRADQFCVYNQGPAEKVPAFIIEYKAPHKLSLAHIQVGLQDMELDQVVRYKDNEKPKDLCRRVVAAVITQTYSYMVNGGIPYGYVCTGEAFIFLHVTQDDPSTVYYYLSVPKEDVDETTGWTGDLNGDNQLHLTSVGQVLAFTLRALRTPPRDTNWTKRAVSQLKTWEMIYDNILDEIDEDDIPSSEYKPPRSRDVYCRMSPVRTRLKSAVTTSCHPLQELSSSDHDDDVGDPNTPSRRPRGSYLAPGSSVSSLPTNPIISQGSKSNPKGKGKGKDRQYCTQRCLRGLLTGGRLDVKCPNRLDHGVDRHQLNPTMLLDLLDKQLSRNDLDLDSELGCKSLHIHGTRGALFKVTLWSHGYTFVGKGVPVEFIEHSRHEELVYSHLTSIQGKSVPVLLGGLDLRSPISYDGIAEIVHLMLMSYAGGTLAKRRDHDVDKLVQEAKKSLQAIHRHGVLHKDPNLGNLTWNDEYQQVMFIDFERATLQTTRTPLDSVSPNQKRQRENSVSDKSPNKRYHSPFEKEMRRMRIELQVLRNFPRSKR